MDLDHILVAAELLEGLDLHHLCGLLPGLRRLELLDGHDLVRLGVHRLGHAAEGALTHALD